VASQCGDARALTLICGAPVDPANGWAVRNAPGDGAAIGEFPRSGAPEVNAAVAAARGAQRGWAARTAVERGNLIRGACRLLENRADELVSIVRAETGKPLADARGELAAAIEMGYFVAGEGRRMYGRTTTSGVPHKSVSQVRVPLGVAALVVASNTPLPNYAWKTFPALLCGNTAILKPSEDTPFSATRFVQLMHEAGIPGDVLHLVNGLGSEAGAALVEADVDLVSFTGSVGTGRAIAASTGGRLIKTCLELGGKNPLVVCDDADVAGAVDAAVRSAFSNAGQRCAAGSRIIVMDGVYDEFRDAFVRAAGRLRVGVGDDADLGPVVNERQLAKMLDEIGSAVSRGGVILCGGHRVEVTGRGSFLAPTIVEGLPPDDTLSRHELFGPVCSMYRVPDYQSALELADDTEFGLTAAIWTSSIDRAAVFADHVKVGMVVVNGPTFGSEPHMPFGGFRQSGNGFREAGTEALDVYSDWKTVSVIHDPGRV
jgi:acyl-CoA reductase-like NAD-dependent aldehyde dehydrogenase